MSEIFSSRQPRRRFLGKAAAALAAITAGFPSSARAAVATDGTLDSDHDAWIKASKGKHRQFFHAFQAQETAMLMASNYLDAYTQEFNVKPGEVNAVIGVHGPALAIGFSDAAWAKYAMGKSAGINDPSTKEPVVRNVFAGTGPLGVASLQKRGVTFLLCNTALRRLSRMLAEQRGETYEAVYEDLKSSQLPGVILVPALVVAINRAQEAGFSYVRA